MAHAQSDLPPEIMALIIRDMRIPELAQLRTVSHCFNTEASRLLGRVTPYLPVTNQESIIRLLNLYAHDGGPNVELGNTAFPYTKFECGEIDYNATTREFLTRFRHYIKVAKLRCGLKNSDSVSKFLGETTNLQELSLTVELGGICWLPKLCSFDGSVPSLKLLRLQWKTTPDSTNLEFINLVPFVNQQKLPRLKRVILQAAPTKHFHYLDPWVHPLVDRGISDEYFWDAVQQISSQWPATGSVIPISLGLHTNSIPPKEEKVMGLPSKFRLFSISSHVRTKEEWTTISKLLEITAENLEFLHLKFVNILENDPGETFAFPTLPNLLELSFDFPLMGNRKELAEWLPIEAPRLKKLKIASSSEIDSGFFVNLENLEDLTLNIRRGTSGNTMYESLANLRSLSVTFRDPLTQEPFMRHIFQNFTKLISLDLSLINASRPWQVLTGARYPVLNEAMLIQEKMEAVPTNSPSLQRMSELQVLKLRGVGTDALLALLHVSYTGKLKKLYISARMREGEMVSENLRRALEGLHMRVCIYNP